MTTKFIFVYASTGSQCFSKESEFKSRQAAEKYLKEDFGFGGDDILVMTEKQRQTYEAAKQVAA